jgi:mxaJ protein
MCSAFKRFALACFVAINCATGAEGGHGTLRIAADPNNLPFSNDKLEGFENEIAEIVARELGKKIEYEWRAQRRGFFREALKDGNCDLIMGTPAGFERALTTKPYYRSSYVFISRVDRQLAVTSLDDPKLRELKIGVQLIGDDGVNTPPAHALAERGVITNLVGFTLYGNYAEPNPPARIVEAVSDGSIDLAIVWGPLAGYFASRQKAALRIFAVPKDGELPFSFPIAIGVRKGKKELRDQVDEILTRRREEIQRILREYNVPLDAGS